MLRNILRQISVIAVCGMALCAPAQAQLISTDLEAPRDPATVTVQLAWPQPAQLEVEQNGEELVLHLGQPVDYDAFASVAPRLAKWVSAAFFGYDSMVFKLAPLVTARALLVEGRVVLTLTAPQAAELAAEPTPTQATASERLLRLKAELLWTMGDTWQASELLAQLAQRRPNDLELLAMQSVVEARLERWRLASAHLDQAALLQGLETRGDWPLRGSEHAPRLLAEWLHDRQNGGTGRDGLRASGHTFLLPGTRLSLGYELASVQADKGSLLAPLLGTAGVAEHLISAGLRHDFESGSWLGLRGAGTPQQGGAVLEGALWDAGGATRLTLGYRELRWDLPVFVALGATRDSVGLARTVRSWSSLGRWLRGEVSGQIGASLERWSSERDPGTLSDLQASGTLRYTSWLARPRISVAYSVQHIELLEHEKTKGRQELGAILVRNQLHLLTASAQLPLWRWLGIDALAGYGVSVWGQDAAQLGGGLAWLPPSGVRASVRYQRGLAPAGYGAVSENLVLAAGAAF